jgi:nucleotide-binding universal stress UspA family protein
MKRQTILIPLDGSAFSRQIIPHLLRLFDPRTHSLLLLRVAELPAGVTSAPPWPISSTFPLPTHFSERDFERARFPIYSSQEEQSARSTLEGSLRDAARALEEAGFQVSVAVRFGDPAAEIANVVKVKQVDLVALATHGRTGLRQLMLGSVAEQLLQILDVPVLLVRPHDEMVDDSVVASGDTESAGQGAI